MSEARKSKKIVNSIGVGIMAFLSSGVSLMQTASAADVNEVRDAGDMLENDIQATSANQEIIDALDKAGDAINTAQGAITDAGDIPNGTEIQGELSGAAEALGKLNDAVEALEQSNAAAAEAVEDYLYAVEADPYRDGAAENVADAKNAADSAQAILTENKEAADALSKANQTAQEDIYENKS